MHFLGRVRPEKGNGAPGDISMAADRFLGSDVTLSFLFLQNNCQDVTTRDRQMEKRKGRGWLDIRLFGG